MSWNYRVVKRLFEHEYEYAIYEVYYDEQGNPNSITTDPVFPRGETFEEFKSAFNLYAKALGKPVLIYEEIAGH